MTKLWRQGPAKVHHGCGQHATVSGRIRVCSHQPMGYCDRRTKHQLRSHTTLYDNNVQPKGIYVGSFEERYCPNPTSTLFASHSINLPLGWTIPAIPS
jgi:hypothetical protein